MTIGQHCHFLWCLKTISQLMVGWFFFILSHTYRKKATTLKVWIWKSFAAFQRSGIRKKVKLLLCFSCFPRRRRVAQSWMMSCVTCVFACFVASFCCLWRVNGVVWRSSKGAPPLPREPICGSWADDLGLAPPALTTPNTQSSNCEIHFLKFEYKSQI